jgi:hypothetical protein
MNSQWQLWLFVGHLHGHDVLDGRHLSAVAWHWNLQDLQLTVPAAPVKQHPLGKIQKHMAGMTKVSRLLPKR